MININLDKAKNIAHEIRRQKRSEEFQPLDEKIMKQIPGTDVSLVESKRQEIRDKYLKIQGDIDSSTSPEVIKNILENI